MSAPAATGVLPLPGPDPGLLYVPDSYRPSRPAPLVVSLRGCCGGPGSGLSLVREFADDAGLIVLSPDGDGGSWDVISGGFGPDASLIDTALVEVFRTYNVDPDRVAISGFSDGASYALSLGLTNGDLFTHVIAHSPGFMAPGDLRGRPKVYVAHGREDRTLPFDNTEEIVAELREQGYGVVFEPFDAGHKRQPHIFADAVNWLTA
ncbi:MAG TPA: alpha/beta hydrolase-fold protein [Actinomycetota bacterium]|nr:alpha/beta hydrolase-fold protein [Actinomycetota bacterium]